MRRAPLSLVVFRVLAPAVHAETLTRRFGPAGMTASAQRATWRTPRRLRPGTYTFFCRVHPFIRGAFRVRP